MASKVTEDKRSLLESRIAGSNKVEIKITVTEDDEDRACEALDFGDRDAVRCDIYSLDTPELALTGLV